jgi:hypothetical protein
VESERCGRQPSARPAVGSPPARIPRLGSFRRFPKTGRVDYLDGEVDIGMSPEDLQTHGTLKAALTAELFCWSPSRSGVTSSSTALG